MRDQGEYCPRCESGGLPAFGLRIGISLALAGQGMVFGLGYNNALKAGEAPLFGTPLYWVLHGALIVTSLAVAFILGIPLVRETVLAIRARRLSVEALFVLSATGAFTGSLISTFRGSGSVYYEVVSIVLCVYAIGKQIGAVQKGRVGEAVSAFRHAFDSATVAGPDGERRTIPVGEVTPDSAVLVSPGDPIPVDGVIDTGNGYVRETALTGEPAPVPKGPGDPVMAGTWSVDGNFTIRPDPRAARRVDQILAMLEEAPMAPSRLQESADRLMQFFVPVVSMVAAGTFLGWWLFSSGPVWDALFNSMAVLLVACPCALGLAMPAGIWAGLYYLGQRGIVGRHGHLLDSLAECDVVIFDKTGTLTRFSLEADLRLVDGGPGDPARIREEIASLGKASDHPVSTALAGLSEAELAVKELTIFPGKGLGGRIGGVSLLIGEKDLLLEGGVPMLPSLPQGTGKPVYIARDLAFTGIVFLKEQLREGAESALQELEASGCQCHILSGDPAPAITKIGGIPVRGGLSPLDKADLVREAASRSRHTLFIGDGINDVPAMQAADASLAIDLGAALATEFSDGLLVDGRINALPAAIHHARSLKRHLRGNLRFALVYNLIGMALAAGGVLHPVVAALLMMGSSVIVSFRALRAAGRSA